MLGYKKQLKDTTIGYNEGLLPLRLSEQVDPQQWNAEDQTVQNWKIDWLRTKQEGTINI